MTEYFPVGLWIVVLNAAYAVFSIVVAKIFTFKQWFYMIENSKIFMYSSLKTVYPVLYWKDKKTANLVDPTSNKITQSYKKLCEGLYQHYNV
jgi:hypothetical protein